GTYCFRAEYSGDSNYPASSGDDGGGNPPNIAAECFNMKAAPSVNTVLVPASPVSIGTAVHDTSTLTGATADAGGTISYAIYTNNTCTTAATAADGISGQPTGGAVTNGNPADSSAVTFSKAGSFWWQATYSGDNNNTGPVKSACTSEPLVV